jgi:hypothetical protein
MQNDNRHTDKKLQELEKQSLPDLSKMDEHWQQMKTLLQPAVIPAKKRTIGRKRIIGWVIAAAFIGAVVVVGYKMINPKNAATTAVNPRTSRSVSKPGSSNDNVSSGKSSKPANEDPAKDPVTHNPVLGGTSSVKHTIAKNSAKRSKSRQVKDKSTVYQKQIFPLQDYSKDTLSNKQTSAAEARAMLSNFFKQLEKPAQQFTVSNKRDTIITGRDGTALLIPAYAFAGTDEVVITMKEYYSYQDIVTNKLNTLSNDEQLVTGGMLHLMATVNGKEVDLQPGKSIRWFIPDTTPAMSQMQLFNGVATPAGKVETDKRTKFMEGGSTYDTVPSYVRYNNINWIPQSRAFVGSYLYTGVKVLDLRDDPFKTQVNQRQKRTGFFFIAPNSELNKRELAKALKEKYGYDKVKVRKPKKDRRFWSKIFDAGFGRGSQALGDSTWMDIRQAQTYRLPASDTMISTGGVSTYNSKSKAYKAYKALFNEISKNDLSKRYSVDIRTMGWVNCDRFYNQGPKIDYYVNIKDTAANYFTVLVFKNIRSMMSGSVNGNTVMFGAVPTGQEAKIISVGIQNGKPVLAVKDVVLSTRTINDLVFEPTTPSAFKQEVGTMDE